LRTRDTATRSKTANLNLPRYPTPKPAPQSERQQLQIASPGLARALFELYLGDASLVPDGRAAWAGGARELLDSETVKRETRKAGSG
jgi:hypothetical protein